MQPTEGSASIAAQLQSPALTPNPSPVSSPASTTFGSHQIPVPGFFMSTSSPLPSQQGNPQLVNGINAWAPSAAITAAAARSQSQQHRQMLQIVLPVVLCGLLAVGLATLILLTRKKSAALAWLCKGRVAGDDGAGNCLVRGSSTSFLQLTGVHGLSSESCIRDAHAKAVDGSSHTATFDGCGSGPCISSDGSHDAWKLLCDDPAFGLMFLADWSLYNSDWSLYDPGATNGSTDDWYMHSHRSSDPNQRLGNGMLCCMQPEPNNRPWSVGALESNASRSIATPQMAAFQTNSSVLDGNFISAATASQGMHDAAQAPSMPPMLQSDRWSTLAFGAGCAAGVGTDAMRRRLGLAQQRMVHCGTPLQSNGSTYCMHVLSAPCQLLQVCW